VNKQAILNKTENNNLKPNVIIKSCRIKPCVGLLGAKHIE